jgi:hypothetical protein
LHERDERGGAQAFVGDPGLLGCESAGLIGEAVCREQFAAKWSVAT